MCKQGTIGFGFASERLGKWRVFANQIKREITSDTQLKNALRETGDATEGNKVRIALLHLAECLKSLFSVQSRIFEETSISK